MSNYNNPMRFRSGKHAFDDIPGVVYPKESYMQTECDSVRKGNTRYKEVSMPPAGYISTRCAADILSCSPAATRVTLDKKKCKVVMVRALGKVPTLYWEQRKVLSVAAERAPIVTERPADTYSSDEMIELLGVSRSTLYRYVAKGRVPEIQVRMADAVIGTRKTSFFPKAEADRLAVYIRKIRECEKRAESLRIEISHQTHKK